jgi:hypothetical protein
MQGQGLAGAGAGVGFQALPASAPSTYERGGEVSLYLLLGVPAVAATLGFAAGFFTFKRALGWCRTCGANLRCVDCLRRAQLHHNMRIGL